MKSKLIEQKLLKNESLFEQKIISKKEYFNTQFKLLEELNKEIDQLERLDFGIFKIVKSLFTTLFKFKN